MIARKMTQLAVAAAICAGGLVAPVLLVAPAEAASIGGGGSGIVRTPSSGSGDFGTGTGGTGGIGGHTSDYKGAGVFGADSRDNATRNNPNPLGTYLHGVLPGGKTLRADVKNEYEVNKPCQTRGGDTLWGMNNHPVGIKWEHQVTWNRTATAVTGSNWVNKGCITSESLVGYPLTCATRITGLTFNGPTGVGLPAENERTGPATTSGGAISTPFGDALANGTFAGLTVAQKKNLMTTCGDLQRTYDYDPTEQLEAGIIPTNKLVGNYRVDARIEFVTCRFVASGDWTQKFTNPNGENGWNMTKSTRTFNGKETFRGCDPATGRSQRTWNSILCEPVPGSTERTFRHRADNGGAYSNFDFAANYASCVQPPPPLVPVCAYPDGRDGVTATVNGSPGILRNGAIVSANGKQVSAVWPTPTVRARRPGGPLIGVPLRDRRMVYDVVNSGAYASLTTGLEQKDPVSSSVSLRSGVQPGFGNPLQLQFFKAAAAPPTGASVNPYVFGVNGTPTFTYTDRGAPLFRWDARTRQLVQAGWEEIEVAGTCPTRTLELYVAGSRNAN